MIGCEQAQHLFDAYLNDELSATLSAELDAHRLNCAPCQHQLTLLEACGNVVRLDTREPGLSEDFGDRLMAILDQEQPARRGLLQIHRRLKWAAGGLLGIAASAAMVVLLIPNAPEQGKGVFGVKASPPSMTSAAEWITAVPFDDILGAGELVSSTLELGQFGFSHLQDRLGVPLIEPPLPELDLNTLPSDPQPASDVFDTLPELDDGGVLM